MSVIRIFKATLPSVNYIFTNGKPAIFVQGKFTTNIDFEIQELEREIATGHPHIYIDPAESEIDSDALTPMEILRAKVREELVAEMAAATNPANNMGTTVQEPVKPASTADIAQAAQGGSGVGLAARLVNLTR